MPRGGSTDGFNKGLQQRAKAAEFDDLKARNDWQKKRLGRYVDWLNETNQLEAFIKWDQAHGEDPE